MGIHNSFSISTVWRVANQINMKAFVTICSFLASSACADSQYLIQNVVPVNQPTGIPAMSPYGLYSAPLSPVNYANVVDLQVETPFTFDTMLIKREAEPDTPYVYKSKVINPEDGSNYEIKVQVDRFGNGQSHQQIETQPTYESLRSNYLMGQRMHDDMSQNMMMDNRQMSRMMSRENVMGQRQQMNQRMRNQLMRDQGRMESRMYSMVDQRRMDNMNQQMQEINMRRRNMDDSRMMNRMTERNQMQSSRMIKREADPSFQYTIAAGHPSSQSQYRMGLNMRDQVFGNGLMNQRMAQGSNLMRMNNNLVNQMVRDNMMKGNQMQSHGLIKREADSFIPLSFPTSHLVPYAGYQVPSIMGYTAPLIG